MAGSCRTPDAWTRSVPTAGRGGKGRSGDRAGNGGSLLPGRPGVADDRVTMA